MIAYQVRDVYKRQLMNMTLDGLERLLQERLPTRQKVNGRTHFNKLNFVRYADDFIITGEMCIRDSFCLA